LFIVSTLDPGFALWIRHSDGIFCGFIPPSDEHWRTWSKPDFASTTLCLLRELGSFALNATPETDKMADVSKNAKIWLAFAVSAAVYLIWNFVLNFWPLGR
jgi:hypothetical protein